MSPATTIPAAPHRRPLYWWRRLHDDPLGGFSEAAQYGDAVAVPLGPRRLVIVASPPAVQAVLVRHADATVKGRSLRMARHVLGDGLLTSEGPLWREERKRLQPFFTRPAVRRYGPTMVALTETLTAWDAGAVIDLAAEMARLTLAIATATLFGADVGAEAEAVHRDLAWLMRDVSERVQRLVRWPDWMPTASGQRRREALAHLDHVVQALIAGAPRTQDNVLARLAATFGPHPSPAEQRLIRDEVMTLVLAGHETTANALTWTFHLLMQHPEWDERLQAEWAQTLGGAPATPETVEALPYTRAVIQESLRLYPPAWLLVREVVAPFDVAGARFLPQTQCVLSPWVTHRDPRWWSDASEFRPERWLGPDSPAPPLAYFPFGAGPRLCIGRAFALQEAALILVTVGRRWRFRRVADTPVVPEPLLTLRPRDGLPVTVERRG